MKQVLHDLNTGKVCVEDVPCPAVQPGHVLIRTSTSLISAGTERMLVEFGRANLFEKARRQPDKVRMFVNKIKTDGLLPAIETVRARLDEPLPMGYCNSGTVIDVGPGVATFAIGDRVASNGRHAEIVCVPQHLCAKVPSEVSDEGAVFAVIGAIALQGIRLVKPTLGEAVVVTGLGLVGLAAVQLLRAHGCRVLGIDLDPEKLEIAGKLGAETVDLSRGDDAVAKAMRFSRGRGVDAVLLTAATKSSEPLHQAAAMCRKRGRIVLVGVVGLRLSRADFYEKEISFQVSCSYGPGRYDPLYEEQGHDYPVGFVRWTEQRNLEAVLDMLSDGRFDSTTLISHRYPLEQAARAYELLATSSTPLGILLQYQGVTVQSTAKLRASSVVLAGTPRPRRRREAAVVMGVIGSGNYSTQLLIPAFKDAGATLKSIASQTGVRATHAGKRYGFHESTTEIPLLLADPQIEAIAIATRHDTHAGYVCAALHSGKHVFVEKPLAIGRDELKKIEAATAEALAKEKSPLLMVGFNRRFAPQVRKIKQLLDTIEEPKTFVVTVNAGAVPSDHWTRDPQVGGGRIIGEACHFIDLLRFLAGDSISGVQVSPTRPQAFAGGDDVVTFTLTFVDGSSGTVHYLSNGHRSFPKERLEIFCGGRILQLDNFRRLRAFGWSDFAAMNLWRQDKGGRACAAAFVDAIREGQVSPIPFDELVEVTRASFDIVDMLSGDGGSDASGFLQHAELRE